jgi:hypothetical protein
VQGSGSKKAFQEAPRGTHRPSTPETRRRRGACILDAARRLFFVEKTRVASKGNDAETGSDADQGRREARYLVCGAGDRDHARVSVDEAPRSRCGHLPATETVEASTEECMAHQSCVPATDHDTEQSNPSAVARELAGLAMIKRRRSLWHGSREPTAQLGGQDKSRTVRPGRTAKECWQISAEAQCALSGRNVRSRETPAKSRFAAHCAKGSPDRSYDRAAPRVFRPFCSALVSWDTADISCAHSKVGARAAAWETQRPSRKNEGG